MSERCNYDEVFYSGKCIRRRHFDLKRLMEIGEIPLRYEIRKEDIGMNIEGNDFGRVIPIDVGRLIVYKSRSDGSEIFIPMKGSKLYRKIKSGFVQMESIEQAERRKRGNY